MPHNTLVVPWGRHGGRDASDRRSGRQWVLGPHRARRGLATPARLGSRIGPSTIPLYPLDGLAFGNGGLLPPRSSEHSVQTVAEIGVVLLLPTRGLEDTGENWAPITAPGCRPARWTSCFNFPPSLLTGLVFGWGPLAAVLLGGATHRKPEESCPLGPRPLWRPAPRPGPDAALTTPATRSRCCWGS